MQVEVAERGVTDAELQLAPSLNLGSQVNYATQTVLAPNTTWSLQGAIVVPFYDGGARYGAMRDARAAAEQARQALVTTRIAAIVAAAQAEREVGVVRASRDVAARRRDLADRIDHRTRDGVRSGSGNEPRPRDIREALRQAEIDLALLDFQVGQARANAVLANAECVY